MLALGTFINNNVSERSDHATNIDLGVGMTLVPAANDGNPLVRIVSGLYDIMGLAINFYPISLNVP